MKKAVKIMSIALLVMVMLTSILTISTYAIISPNDVSASIDDTIGATEITQLGGKIIGAVRVFGVVASVLILVVLGVKYMLASPEGKADYKSNMITYIIVAVLIFGATQVASLVYNALVA